MKSRERRGFTQREIAEAANNLMIKSLRPLNRGDVPEERLRKLRNYAQAVVAPCFEHVQEGYLTAEELVTIFSAAAVFVQASCVMNTDKLPTAAQAKEIFE